MEIKTATQLTTPTWHELCERVQSIPLFAPYRELTFALGSEWPSMERFNAVARQFSPGLELEFTQQQPGSRRKRAVSSSLRGYIQQIAEDNVVPMRSNSVHDLFNYLTFVLFPQTKCALMRIHHQESRAMEQMNPILPRGGRGRTRNQDLATLFDEGGSIAYGPCEDELIVFGHGILEQFILQPRKVRAFCWACPPIFSTVQPDFASIDQLLARDLLHVEILTDSSRFSGRYIPELLTTPAIKRHLPFI